jgi:hypothetical protein
VANHGNWPSGAAGAKPVHSIQVSREIKYLECSNSINLQRGFSLPLGVVKKAVEQTNQTFENISSVAPYIYELLQLRNLSAMVGAAFARELQEASAGSLLLNPHQDGYPDLLLMDSQGKTAWNKLESSTAKEHFSPFPTGGLEIKATLGDVPSEKDLAKVGKSKPKIGETRVDLITSVNWKAHHRETNHLMAILWDFLDGIPAVMFVSYSDSLNESDWGKMVLPKDGGGRTTSVSIMGKSGIEKMLRNPLLIINDSRYIDLVTKKSGQKPVFW